MDSDFAYDKAVEKFEDRNYKYTRVNEIESQNSRNAGKKTEVFKDGISSCDIKQGQLGDCYLLSAMSVIAHLRPDLIRAIFHPESRTYREDGLYTVMFYRDGKPEIITVDDMFMQHPGTKSHPFV